MHSSKLIEVIKTLTTSEQKKVDQFLRSPYFFKGKVDPKQTELFEYIIQSYPNYDDERLQKGHVYEFLFPGEELVKGKLEKVMTFLLQSIQRFVVLDTSNPDHQGVRSALRLARFYRQKKLDRFFQKTLEKIRKEQKQIKQRDKEYFFEQYLIHKEISEYESFYNTRNADLNLPATLKYLDLFYILAKQEYTSWLLAQHKYHIPIDFQENIKAYEKLFPIFQDASGDEVPLIKVYNQVLLLLRDDDDDSPFPHLKELIQTYKQDLPLEQLKDLQALCRNYSIRQYNKGNRKYLREAFLLYREHLEEGYLYYHNGLLPSTIKNIVTLGLKLKEYNWVLDFLNQYRYRIVGTKFSDEVYSFNLASIYFSRKDYDQALEYLSESYEDWYYKIAARRLEIKIYYETDSVLLDPKLDAFKIFIYRIAKSKLPQLQKSGNNNFADLVKQIRSSKTSHNQNRLQKLLHKIKTKKVVAEEEWLIEKWKN